ncbi:MAG TPA: hypothetical protein VGO82_02900, partial [Enterovirga sp.]|nr:hypothetical protein [Enterovirga sp.]
LLLSSDSDLALLHAMSARAGFQAKQVAERSIFLESFPLYELSKSPAPVQADAPVANAFVPVSGQAQTV